MPKKKLEADISYFINNQIEDDENFTRFPHTVLRQYMSKLKPQEFVILSYIVDLTYGYHENLKIISIDYFINGRTTADGTVLDNGVGLCRSSLFKFLNSLKEKGLIIRIIDNENMYDKKIYYKLRRKKDPIHYDKNGNVVSDYYKVTREIDDDRMNLEVLNNGLQSSANTDYRGPQTKTTVVRKHGPLISSANTDYINKKETSLRKKPSKKEKLFVATLRCDDVCEDSSQPEEKTKPKKQPSDFDKNASEQLRKIVEETTGIKNERQSKSWPNNFRLLREIDKIEEAKIQEILNWYQIVSPLKEKYTPVVRCGKTFREKFQKLNDALERWTRDNPKQIKKIKPKRVVVPLRPIRPREISIPQICFEKKSPFFRSYYQFLCERDMDRYFGRDDKTLKRELKQHQREFRKFLKERIDRSKLTLEEVQAAGLEFLITDKKDSTSAS